MGITTSGVHCAYNVTFRAGIVNEAAETYDVPDPLDSEFHCAKVNPLRLSDAADTVAGAEYSIVSGAGTEPRAQRG